jgi:alkanesulfonate monooxygenase SsuD/methylene tetrahydromethanopterin reductase-like flavin-dependent oxidoreductase (luciferase family)
MEYSLQTCSACTMFTKGLATKHPPSRLPRNFPFSIRCEYSKPPAIYNPQGLILWGSLIISAMAAVTKSLSFGITASTTYESPYALARKFSTLDHLTTGRVGWNVVTSYLESAAKSFGLDNQIPHDERYLIAEEFVEVFYKLLEGSWRDDSVVKDVESGQYTVPERVRHINHKGYASSLHSLC